MLLIKSGTLITASDTYQTDILVGDGKILEIGQSLHAPEAETVEAANKLVLPGGVDAHTHFDLEMFDTVSSDDHYTGHKAAAFGGTTTVIDFVVQEPQGFKYSVDLWLEKARKAAVDYSFHMNLTHFDDQVANDIPSLVEMGITSMKVFTAYNAHCQRPRRADHGARGEWRCDRSAGP